MDIICISSKGSQYRYFQQLCKNAKINAKTVTLRPSPLFKLFNHGLTKNIINSGLEFHMERKIQKYATKNLPQWLWTLYFLKSALDFSLLYLRFYKYLEKEQPKIIGIWNGHRLTEQALRAVADKLNIQCCFFENGLMPDTTTMDFKGVNYYNSVPRTANFFYQYAKDNHLTSHSNTSLVVREDHKKRKKNITTLSKEIPEKYIFVPFQVNFDSQVLVNSRWIRSMHDFYAAIEYAANNSSDKDLYFVIKEHPSDPRVYKDLHHKHSNIIFVKENTESLIKGAQAVITLNSSVGLESLIYEQKVIVVGESCFDIPDLVKKANNPKELSNHINQISEWSCDTILCQSFIQYLKQDYLIPASWHSPNKKHFKVVEARIQERIK
jgi:capsular polysaccharide export protein